LRLKIKVCVILLLWGLTNELIFFTAIADPSEDFSLKWTCSTGLEAYIGPVTKDINGDGIHEIFLGGVVNGGSGGRIMSIDGLTGDILWQVDVPGIQSPHSPIAIADLDNDGTYELVHGRTSWGSGTTARNCEDGSIFWDVEYPARYHQLAIADTDENGYPYVYITSDDVSGSDTGRIRKLRGIDGSLVAEHFVWHPCYGGISIADLEDDGEYEIIVTDRNYGSPSAIGLQCYNEDLELLWSSDEIQCSSHAAVIVDVDGNGILDVVAMHQSSSNGGIYVIDGATGIKMPGKYDNYLGLTAHCQPAVYDIDNDGNLELITAWSSYAKVWDLGRWALDGTIQVTCSEPPDFGNVMGDDDLEIIVCSGMGDRIYNNDYQLVETLPTSSFCSVVQDIDNDGLNELLLLSDGYIGVYDTLVEAPTPRVRTDTPYYSERRTATAEFIPSIETIGETYYVAKNGNDSNNGTEVSPWLTIQKAASEMIAGDTVYIKEGNYNEHIVAQNSGSAGKYITYAAYENDEVTVDGTNISGWPAGLFQIYNLSYIRVSGIRITNVGPNPPRYGIQIYGSDHIIIENNYIYNTWDSGIWAGVSTNITIDNNEIDTAHSWEEPFSGFEEGISIYNVDSFEVKNNHVHHCKKDGIDAKHDSNNGKIFNNHVHDVEKTNIYVDHGTNIEIYNNHIHDSNGTGISVSVEDYNWTDINIIENITVYNNLVYRTGGGFCSWIDPNSTKPAIRKNILVMNNVFYNNSNCGIRITKNLEFDNFVIRNNIISHNGNQQLLIRNATELIDHNLVYGSTEVTGDFAIILPPEFINPTTGNLHLLENSPAIDNGSYVNAPSVDYDGNPRPQGLEYDIGPYEYNISSPINFPPEFSDISPSNGTIDVAISTSSLSLMIEDPDDDRFDWTIETSPDIGSSSGFAEENGTKSCSISGLSYSTTYRWFVNATDGNTWNRKSYIFITEDEPGGQGGEPLGGGGMPPLENESETGDNNPPIIPSKPSGPTTVQLGVKYSFSSSTSDVDDDLLSLKFDWGDGNYSNWSEFVSSGTSVNMSYNWTSSGQFEIRAIAQDETELESNWSEPLSIIVTCSEEEELPVKPNISLTSQTHLKKKGIKIKFDASRSYDPERIVTSYDWSFGDGDTGRGLRPVHIYENPGDYTVTLRLTDENGIEYTTSVIINVASEVASIDEDSEQGLSFLSFESLIGMILAIIGCLVFVFKDHFKSILRRYDDNNIRKIDIEIEEIRRIIDNKKLTLE